MRGRGDNIDAIDAVMQTSNQASFENHMLIHPSPSGGHKLIINGNNNAML